MAVPRPLSGLSFDKSVASFTWTALLPGDRGEPIELPEYDVLGVKAIGTFNGARLSLEASADGRAFGFLCAPLRQPGSLTINAKPTHVRPVVVGGGPGTLLQICVIAARD